MPPSIETIDKLPQPVPHARVNAAGKSNEEQDREAFKQMLRRRMGQMVETDGDGETEALIVDIDLSQGRQESAEQPPEEESDESKVQDGTAEAGDTDKSPAPPDHIDLKA